MYNLNLLPPKLRKKHKKRIRFDNPTYGVFLLVFIIIVCFIVSAFTKDKITDLQTTKTNVESKIHALLPSYSELVPKQVDNTYYELLKNRINELSSMLNNSTKWYYVLDSISANTPSDITVTSIKDNGNGSIHITAKASTMTSMAIMVENFNRSDDFNNTTLETYTFKDSTYINRNNYGVDFTLVTSYGEMTQYIPNINDTNNQDINNDTIFNNENIPNNENTSNNVTESGVE